MRVSVVIPSYNAAQHIADALQSIRRQDYDDVEVILSDGASTDRTVDIVKAAGLANVKVISEVDRGVPHALNRGFGLASGDILCWLNSDDVYMHSGAISLAVRSLSKTDAPFVYGHCMTLNECGRIRRKLLAFVPPNESVASGANLFTGALFFPRRSWKAFGGFSERFQIAFEYELITHLFAQGAPMLINEYIAAFRQYPGGLSSRFRAQMHAERDEIHGLRRQRLSPWMRLRIQAREGTLKAAISNRFVRRDVGRYWEEVFR